MALKQFSEEPFALTRFVVAQRRACVLMMSPTRMLKNLNFGLPLASTRANLLDISEQKPNKRERINDTS